MKRLLKWILFFFILISLIIVYSIIFWKNPPLESIKQARSSITEAELNNAQAYAGELYHKALSCYDSAMYYWQQENTKINLFRDFTIVKYYAGQADEMARASIEYSGKASGNARDLLQKQINLLRNEMELYHDQYAIISYFNDQHKVFVQAKLLMQEGILAFGQKNYALATQKLDSSESLLRNVIKCSKEKLESYFSDYHNWQIWKEKTISESRRDKTNCIIIDKFARKCHLYRKGLLTNSYDVELGLNWLGDKNFQGDKATPEGFYKIIKKKSGGQTKYYKALLLDYPNNEDKKRFETNKKHGKINKDALIGNLIQIHGHGGKGADWTDGCIALSDSDMDKLFSACSNGTKVTIVGSLRPLNEILKSSDE